MTGTAPRGGSRGAAWAVWVAIVLSSIPPAEAQSTRPARPYGGLFGQRLHDPNGRQAIDFTMSLSDAYDDNRIGQSGEDTVRVPFNPTGVYTNMDAAIRYTQGRRLQRVTVTGDSAVRYEPGLGHLLTANYHTNIAFTTPLWRSARLDLAQGAAYTPYYQLELFPALSVDASGPPQRAATDYVIWKQPAFTYISAVGFSQSLGTRTGLQLQYDRRTVAFKGGASDLRTEGAAITLTHRVTRYGGFHIGFGSRDGQYGSTGGNRIRTQDVNIGLDSARPLSLSRRTTLSFSTGSSIVPQGAKHYYRLTGDASLRREIGRTWTASLEYRRALQFIEALPRPFFSDSISVGGKGNLSRRFDVGVAGGFSSGQVGLIGPSAAYSSYTGSARASIAVTRHYALYSEYMYYDYRFSQPPLANAFPARLNRHTARVGVKLWFPVLH